MAQPQSADRHAHVGSPTYVAAEALRFEPGGQVALLQSEIERRFEAGAVATRVIADTPHERLIRAASVTAGYLLLAGGFAAVAVAIF